MILFPILFYCSCSPTQHQKQNVATKKKPPIRKKPSVRNIGNVLKRLNISDCLQDAPHISEPVVKVRITLISDGSVSEAVVINL